MPGFAGACRRAPALHRFRSRRGAHGPGALNDELSAPCVPCAPAAAQGNDLDFTITNRTSLVVREFYALAFDEGEWTGNLLADGYILPGESATFNVTDGAWLCDFEIMFWFSDGSNFYDEVDICAYADYTID